MLTERACRVLIVDDHPIFRDGLRALLRRVLPSAILAEAGSAAEAFEQVAICRPHLVLLDVNLPGANGLELARRLRETDRQVRMLMVAAETDPWVVQEALAAGASGFVAKTRTADCLEAAVPAVMSGGVFLCPDSQAAWERAQAQGLRCTEPPGPAILSSREREVLRYLVHGENTKTIATLLQISPKTVETHRQHITRKLGTNSVVALARYAFRHGLTSDQT